MPKLAKSRALSSTAPDAVFVLDETGFAKQGTKSVGVARQYSGTLGKIGNCQITVSLHAVGRRGTVPLGFRLYLPEDWCEDAERRARAKIPEDVEFQTKPQIGADLVAPDRRSPEYLQEFFESEIARWAKTIKASGVMAE